MDKSDVVGLIRKAEYEKANYLNLQSSGIVELPPEIGRLTQLTSLDLTNNRLSSLPVEIGTLESLKNLNLHSNKLVNLPSEIGKLKNLTTLNLRDNLLRALPIEIGLLSNLVSLELSLNKLIELPVEIGQLSKLQELRLSGNPLPDLSKILGRNAHSIIAYYFLNTNPGAIARLTGVSSIDFSNIQLNDLPSEISQFLQLTSLLVHKNQLSMLPLSIGQCSKLTELDLSHNRLSRLPAEIKQLNRLKKLDLRANSLSIPPEILNKIYEPQTVINYYFSVVEQQRRPLNELKLLFVGQGSVGKTSLIHRILHGTFDQNQTKTEGISINQWTVDSQSEIENQKSEIKLNIWDFGGQEIMHATHQFFLTKRSLYLLVLDARLTQEENRVEYWLKIIQSFGGESPVLIVGNKTDQHPLDIDRTGLQKKYPNIVGILETSAATGAGVEALQTEIAKQVDTLPHVRDLLPETWFTVKSKLEELAKDKNFFTQDEYLGLCTTNEVNDETSQHTLIGFLHDLGVVLHFQDDPRLVNLGILNPQWVTNGVYKILNSHELFQNQGTLTLPILNKILNLPEYPSNKRLFIVDMMKKFELCYDIEPDKSFLIPDLLPKDEIYTGEWGDALAFQYHYNVLPSSIITRFIVRINVFIHKNTIWRSGVVLNRGDNTALVKADTEDRKIFIWVSGNVATRKEFLAIIRSQFDAIHQTIVKIEATEKVPLPDAPEAAPVDLAFLQKMASEGRESLPVQSGNQIIDLIVKEVLSRIETDGKRNITINIGGNVGGSFIVGDENTTPTNTKDETK